MDRIKRNERLGAMARILSGSPNRIYTLSHFCELFGAAKSTVSEDIDMLGEIFRQFSLGELTTVAGAAGGVRYRPAPTRVETVQLVSTLSERLSQPGRLLPGGFLYISDVMAEAEPTERMGAVLAAQYYQAEPDFVLTMEAKGIPVALMTARMLNVPLVIARRDSRAYEGPAVKINYICGGSGERIETMALARRAVAPGQKALIIDDFMKGGGTVRGMMDLMHEFSAQVVGIGVVMATAQPAKKRVEGVRALMVIQDTDEEAGSARVVPAGWIYEL